MVKSGTSIKLLKEKSSNCVKKTLRKMSSLKGVWGFLKADAYMYGPLVASPRVLSASSRSVEAVVRKEVRRKKKIRKTSRDVRFAKKDSNQSTFSYVNTIQHGISTPDTQEKRDCGKNVLVSWHDNYETDDVSLVDGELDDSSKEYSSLEEHEAEQVIDKLVKKFGGRNTQELGIDVAKGDIEVEKWFFAVALFNSDRPMDWSRDVLKNIFNSGLVKLTDTLKMSQEETAKVLEQAGFVSYAERTAARLHRLANQLNTQYGGKVSSLEGMSASEICQELTGVSRSSIALFVREMQGVWPAVISHSNRRTEDAAKHLRLSGYKSSLSDERDVVAALNKLALIHVRHFRECPGGASCEMLENVSL